jgi:hypothetical protein
MQSGVPMFVLIILQGHMIVEFREGFVSRVSAIFWAVNQGYSYHRGHEMIVE